MLEATGIVVQYGQRTVLETTPFTIAPGEVCALLGPNGSGKTTLLRVLSGEVTPARGDVQWCSRSIREIPPAAWACQRAMLPQRPQLAFGFPVDDVVMLGRHAFVAAVGESPADRRARDAALAAVGLSALAGRAYDTLSGGEQQRVHLARVLAQAWPTEDVPPPRLLLLDEPLNNLDPPHQHQLLQALRRLARRGLTILLTLHDLNLARTYADSCLLLREGRQAFRGPALSGLSPSRAESLFGLPYRLVADELGHGHLSERVEEPSADN